MSDNKKEILSLFKLNNDDIKKLCRETLIPETNVCVCDSFIAFLDSAGKLVIRGSSSIKEKTASWHDIIKIRSGMDHLLGLTADGTVLSVGNNDYGQCNTQSWSNIRDIYADRYFSVAVTDKDILFFAGRIDRSGISNETERMEKLVSARISEYDLMNQERISKSTEKFRTVTDELNNELDRLKYELRDKLKEELKEEIKAELLSEMGEAAADAPKIIPAAAKALNEDKRKKRCYKCMRVFVGDKFCPRCGYNTATEALFPALKPGSTLQNGKYIVGAELYRSNDGIRYMGYDTENSKRVVIFEFIPQTLCVRTIGYQTLSAYKGMEKKFVGLRESFINYYNTLAILGNQIKIIKIRSVFSENNTAYVAEDYTDGLSLREYMNASGSAEKRMVSGMTWHEVCKYFRPLALDMFKIHHTGHVGHYAISPGNVILSKDNEISLTAFSVESLRHAGGLIEPSLLRGFSAPEQYNRHVRLNEATDIYGFTATIYYALTKIVPEETIKRNDKNGMILPPALLSQLPANAVNLINSGMNLSQNSRPVNFNVVASLLV